MKSINFNNVIALASLALVSLAPVAHADVILDDFNRDDSFSLGSNWTEQTGLIGVSSHQGVGIASGSLATYDGVASSVVSVDAFNTPNTVNYVALVLGYADLSNNLFIKVQNNGLGANYDKFAFYYGNNGFGSISFLTTPFTSGRITASLSGTTATLLIDSNFDGVTDQTYTYDYTPDQIASLGTGIGVGTYGQATFDNFGIPGQISDVPEPGSVAMLVGGLVTGLGVLARRRRK